jgi:hypothetical protein
MSLDLTDATGSGADIVRVKIAATVAALRPPVAASATQGVAR